MKKLCVLVSLVLLLLSSVASADGRNVNNYNYINKNYNATHINGLIINVEVPESNRKYVANPYIAENITYMMTKKLDNMKIKNITAQKFLTRLNYDAGGDLQKLLNTNPDKGINVIKMNSDFIQQYNGVLMVYVLAYQNDMSNSVVPWTGKTVAIKMIFMDMQQNKIIDCYENRFKEDGLFSKISADHMAERIVNGFLNNVQKKMSGKI